MNDDATPLGPAAEDALPEVSSRDLAASAALDELIEAGSEANPSSGGRESDPTNVELGSAADIDPVDLRHRTEAMQRAALALRELPSLDEVTRTRLVRQAMAASGADHSDSEGAVAEDLTPLRRRGAGHERDRRRWLASGGAVAAALALVLGVTQANRGADDPGPPVAEPAMSPENPEGFTPYLADAAGTELINFGDVADAGQFRAAVLATSVTVLADQTGAETEDSAADEQPSGSRVVVVANSSVELSGAESGGGFVQLEADADFATRDWSCLEDLATNGLTPEIIGTGMIADEPVVIAIIVEANRTTAFAVDATCRTRHSLQLAN